jgi:hypothetical protein
VEDLEAELSDVAVLHEMSQELRRINHEEAKLVKLKELLKTKVLTKKLNEKLVIFTEHRDTLDYLEDYLERHGYTVATIHGSKSVDERREAQRQFRQEAKILLATDAAGEGINLQFCRLLINWDIPWNPNRLEQRMGRIHRYGQEHDVYVFNLVAHNTREGQVLERLLTKLDVIREQMGSDKVYDVISDVFEGVSMEKILSHFLLGESDAEVSKIIEERMTADHAKRLAEEQKNRLGHSELMYKEARRLKEASDEQRLQPRFVESFFMQAMERLGGAVEEVERYIYAVRSMPGDIVEELRQAYSSTEDFTQRYLCFDKRVFLDHLQEERYDGLEFINPGNKLFDALCRVIQKTCHQDVISGARFVDPEASEGYLAWVVESTIHDARGSDSEADVSLSIVHESGEDRSIHSPAALVDLRPPVEYAKETELSQPMETEAVVAYAYEHITQPQLEETEQRLKDDVGARRAHLAQAFADQEFWYHTEISKLQSKLLSANPGKAPDKIQQYQEKLEKLALARTRRLDQLDAQLQLSAQIPTVHGCAHVIALSEQEYESSFGMKRDDEVEAIAMQHVMEHEHAEGRTTEDVSARRGLGYDIVSWDPESGVKRYIEVKGRAATGPVMLTENEWNRLGQLGDQAWLYVVSNCRREGGPNLAITQDPAAC